MVPGCKFSSGKASPKVRFVFNRKHIGEYLSRQNRRTKKHEGLSVRSKPSDYVLGPGRAQAHNEEESDESRA